ncbi:MAG: flagellar motor switch phosphatase FliY [Tissierellia bacterium]|nr:flagellar motor switch phosphatase FliY [Tissierellia bacterium]
MLNEKLLSNMERDVIGEVMNISLGSSATSLSSLLSKRVEITVPKINVTAAEEFSYKQLEPAIGVEINYIEGLKGVNIMIWKRSDAKIILEALLNKKMTDEEFEMDEISISAICEVMNQMMGSAATALSDFLGKHINISTPVAFEIDDNNEFKGKYFVEDDAIVVVSFDLFIEGEVQSQFINVMEVSLAKEIVSNFLRETEKSTSIEIGKKENDNIEDEAIHKQIDAIIKQNNEHEEIIKRERIKTAQNKKEREETPVNVRPVEYESFDGEEDVLSVEQLSNLELIMLVPLTISVEIGKTNKQIKDILEISPGSIIELDKQAGALVDIIVNGKLIAKGEVVVVNDNFGVRVVEILKKDELVKITL